MSGLSQNVTHLLVEDWVLMLSPLVYLGFRKSKMDDSLGIVHQRQLVVESFFLLKGLITKISNICKYAP